MTLKHLGDKLQYIRKHLGLSRDYFEKKYDIPAVTIRSWELLTKDIGVYRLTKYIKIFHDLGLQVSFDKLLNDKKDYKELIVNQDNLELKLLNSDFGLYLLEQMPHIILYANHNQDILYFSNLARSIFFNRFNKETNTTIVNIKNILSKSEYELWQPSILTVLRGNNAIISHDLQTYANYTRANLSLIPNFDHNKNVIGIIVLKNNHDQ